MAENDLVLERVRDLAIVRYRSAVPQVSLDLPGIGQSSVAGDAEFLWRSPDVWWMKSRTRKATDLVAWLGHPVIDISDAVVTFHLSGMLARRALATGCPIDLRRGAFPSGSATATRFDLFDIVLHARRDETFDIHVARSYAEAANRRFGEVVARLHCSN